MDAGVIDSHLHLFPDPQTGTMSQGEDHPHLFSGTVEEVRDILHRSPIQRVIAVTTAASELFRRAAHARWRDLDETTRAQKRTALEVRLLEQVRSQNAWIVSVAERDPRLAAGITADPTLDQDAMRIDLEGHLRDGASVAAIKIHPALSFVFPDHPGYMATYALAQEAAVPVISHGGTSLASFYASDIEYCAPKNFVPVLEAFPSLRLVVAHLGHPRHDDLVELAGHFPNVYTDLSFVLGRELIPRDELVRTVRAFGVDRVLFGSDFPACDPAACLELLRASGMSSEELDAITCWNGQRLFFGGSR